MMKTVRVDVPEDVRRVLYNLRVEGNIAYIQGQLDRDLYVRVNKALEAIGGKWNRSVRGHVFEGDPTQQIMEAMATGEVVDVKKSFEFFETPMDVAGLVVAKARIEPGMKVLEPSAGRGAIADMVRAQCPDCRLDVVEIEETNRRILKEKGYKLAGKDFTKFKKRGYDRVVMNPPFSKQQDIDHVRRAFGLMKHGGLLVSVMAPSVKFRENKKTKDFQRLLDEQGGSIEDLPEGAFKESGTGVNTVIVTLPKD